MKINVLLNYYNFDGDWAKPHLQKYLQGKKVLIIPLAYRESQAWDNASWQTIYGVGGEKYDKIMRPFYSFGLTDEDISWLNYYDRNCNFVSLVKSADVLFFTGGMPEKAIARMYDLNIADAVKNHDFVMGASAGAMLQLQIYHITPDEDYETYQVCNGLGMVQNLDLEVHYLATDLQRQCSQTAHKQLNLPIYQMWHEGGLLIVDGKITTMGNVELVK